MDVIAAAPDARWDATGSTAATEMRTPASAFSSPSSPAPLATSVYTLAGARAAPCAIACTHGRMCAWGDICVPVHACAHTGRRAVAAMEDTAVRDLGAQRIQPIEPGWFRPHHPEIMAAAMEIMDARARHETDGPQADGGGGGTARKAMDARIEAIKRARAAMFERYDVRECAEVGTGCFAGVYIASVYGVVLVASLGAAWRPQHRPLVIALKVLLLPEVRKKRVTGEGETTAIDASPQGSSTDADEYTGVAEPDGVGGSSSDSEAGDAGDAGDDARDANDSTVLSNAIDAYEQEYTALERLARGVTRVTNAVAPLMIACMSERPALTITMDMAVASLADLTERLRDMGTAHPMFTWADTEHLIYALFSCLKTAHMRGILHCDLVARNVLVYVLRDAERNGAPYLQLRIGDWGASRMLDARTGAAAPFEGCSNDRHYVVSRVGRAPELIVADHAPFGCAIDVWSAALIAVELIWGLPAGQRAIAQRAQRPQAPATDAAAAPVSHFGAQDIVDSIVRVIGAPPDASFMAPLVRAYSAGHTVSARARANAAETFAEIARCARPANAYGAVVGELMRRDGRHPESSRSVDEVAVALHLDDLAHARRHIMKVLRTEGHRPVDEASCDGRIPEATKRLVYLCLSWNADVRPTAAQAIETPRLWSRPVRDIAAHRIYVDDVVRGNRSATRAPQ